MSTGELKPLLISTIQTRYDERSYSTASDRSTPPVDRSFPELHLTVEIGCPTAPDYYAGGEEFQQRDELSLLDPYFDMTCTRMQLIFNSIDSAGEGKISYVAFRNGLERLGIKCAEDEAFEQFVESIDVDKSLDISLEEFQVGIQRIKLGDLFRPDTIARMMQQHTSTAEPMTVVAYSDKRISRKKLYTNEQLKNFFISEGTSWTKVRWITVKGSDHLNIKRLAIKYRLHPLAIEDTLELHERPKFDRYDMHTFVVFPVLRVDSTGPDELLTMRQRTGSISRIKALHKKQMSIDEIDVDNFSLNIEHIAIFVVGNNTVITVTNDDSSANHVWDGINRRLDAPYSKLRHNDAQFLLYTVTDVVVDRISSVMDYITHRLVHLEEELEFKQHRFQMSKLRSVKNELFKLPRLLKPAREVLKNLIDATDINKDTTAYIRDVHDHVVQVLDDIELQLQMCRLLGEEYRETKANQMNYVMYTLTIITSVFLPAQFLTGVYGMNFDFMPELHEKYGYAFFWLFIILISILLQLYFRYKKWIE